MRRIPFSTMVDVPFFDHQLTSLNKAAPLSKMSRSTLRMPWGALVRGAVLCGVPDWSARRKVPTLGEWEVWRRALHLMSHLEPRRNAHGTGVERTDIYHDEDGSEKVGSSYLIGMAAALAVARETGTADALLHFDELHGAAGRRPDLVAAHAPGSMFFEVKGRFRNLRQAALRDAVLQLKSHAMSAQAQYSAVIATSFDANQLQVHRQWCQAAGSGGEAGHPQMSDSVPLQAARLHEPLASAIWAARLSGATRLARTTVESTTFLLAALVDVGLIVGLEEASFERAIGRLERDGLLGPASIDPREGAHLPVEALGGVFHDSHVLLSWSPGVAMDKTALSLGAW